MSEENREAWPSIPDGRTPAQIYLEACDFRAALADIAHCDGRKVSVKHLQQIAETILAKHRYASGV
jgi:hypothetical protein